MKTSGVRVAARDGLAKGVTGRASGPAAHAHEFLPSRLRVSLGVRRSHFLNPRGSPRDMCHFMVNLDLVKFSRCVVSREGFSFLRTSMPE